MPSSLLSALNPKVTVRFNINFAPPFRKYRYYLILTSSHQTKYIQWEGEQIFGFFYFLFEKALWVLQCCQLYRFVRIFKISSYFCLWKNRSKMRMYIIWTSMRNFSWNFLTFFRKPPSAYIFINCTNLWKFYNCFQHLIWFSSNYQTLL